MSNLAVLPIVIPLIASVISAFIPKKAWSITVHCETIRDNLFSICGVLSLGRFHGRNHRYASKWLGRSIRHIDCG